MKDSATKSFEQSYNCQAAADGHCQLIIATGVSEEANDKGELKPNAHGMTASIRFTRIRLRGITAHFRSTGSRRNDIKGLLQEARIIAKYGILSLLAPVHPPDRTGFPFCVLRHRMERKTKSNLKGLGFTGPNYSNSIMNLWALMAAVAPSPTAVATCIAD